MFWLIKLVKLVHMISKNNFSIRDIIFLNDFSIKIYYFLKIIFFIKIYFFKIVILKNYEDINKNPIYRTLQMTSIY
jgi:hypothetical protein